MYIIFINTYIIMYIRTNKKTINFYKKKGFKKAGSIRDYYKRGRCRDALILSLDIKR